MDSDLLYAYFTYVCRVIHIYIYLAVRKCMMSKGGKIAVTIKGDR